MNQIKAVKLNVDFRLAKLSEQRKLYDQRQEVLSLSTALKASGKKFVEVCKITFHAVNIMNAEDEHLVMHQ